MKFAAHRVWSALVATLVLAPFARATPVEVDLTNLRLIQPYDIKGAEADDSAYLLINGVAQGKEFTAKVPNDKPWTVGKKKPVANTKEPVTLWKGDLADGQFAFLSVTLM